jgi:hypothetical protein
MRCLQRAEAQPSPPHRPRCARRLQPALEQRAMAAVMGCGLARPSCPLPSLTAVLQDGVKGGALGHDAHLAGKGCITTQHIATVQLHAPKHARTYARMPQLHAPLLAARPTSATSSRTCVVTHDPPFPALRHSPPHLLAQPHGAAQQPAARQRWQRPHAAGRHRTARPRVRLHKPPAHRSSARARQQQSGAVQGCGADGRAL